MQPPMRDLGRYRLVSRLASGGTAEVYTAVLVGAHGFQKQAVIKRLPPEFAAHENNRELFIEEAKLMASLSHANLVSVLDFGEVDGSYFLALEHVDGINLGQAMGRSPIPRPVALHIAIQVLRGLGYAHELRNARGERLGIVHRDVCPQNILLGKNGDVKLGDFNLAPARHHGFLVAQEKNERRLYCSPEQSLGETVDARADLFSLGLWLYEALAGKHPYAGKIGTLLLLAVSQAAIPPLQGLREVTPRLAEVLARALQPLPAERFQSAAEMLKALHACEEPPAAGSIEVEELVASVLAASGTTPPLPSPSAPG